MDAVVAQRKKMLRSILFIGLASLVTFVLGGAFGWKMERFFGTRPTVPAIILPPQVVFSPQSQVQSASIQIPSTLVSPEQDVAKITKKSEQSTLCVEVLSSKQEPVSQVEVVAYPVSSLDTLSVPQLEIGGELGVLHQSLPYPEEVIAGTVLPRLEKGESLALARVTTDQVGVAKFSSLKQGFVRLVAQRDGLSARAVVRILPELSPSKDYGCGKEGVRQVLVLEPNTTPLMTGFFPGISALTENSVGTEQKETIVLHVSSSEAKKVSGAVATIRSQADKATCMTDANGQCQWVGLFKGRSTVSVEHPLFAPYTKLYAADEISKVAEVSIQLHQGYKVQGRVQDDRTGTIPSLVRVEWGQNQVFYQAKVETDGRFSMVVTPEGEITVRVRAPGYAQMEKKVRLETNSISEELRFSLFRAGRLRGQVHVSNGSAVMKVLAKSATGEMLGSQKTSQRGEFFFKDLPPGDVFLEVGEAREKVQIYPDHEQSVDIEVVHTD